MKGIASILAFCKNRFFAGMMTFIVLVSAAMNGFSQKQISVQNHGWFIYQGNHRITEKFGIHTEYQFRRDHVITDWQQSLTRVGIDYNLQNNAMATLGYAWIATFQYGDQPVLYSFDEHRIWEQFLVNHKAGRFNFQHRYRLEQRFLETKTADSSGIYSHDGYIFRNRFRYRGMVTVPLSRKELSDNTLFLSLYDEIFLGYGKGIGKNILDQNRLAVLLGWRFNPNVNVTLGYLNQYVVKADGIRAERNHTLSAGLTYNIDFRKQNE